MKSQSAVSTLCRACGQRTIARSNASRPSVIRSTANSIPNSSLALRPLSTTSHTQDQSIDSISLPATASHPELLPSRNTTTNIDSTNPKCSQTKQHQKLFTATITSIHNLTAHATFNKQYWDPKFRRYYTKPEHVLVHDPFSADLDALTPKIEVDQSRLPPNATAAASAAPAKHHHAPRPSLLRVSDVVLISPFTVSELSHRSSRRARFSALTLTRKLKSAGKHKNQIVNDHQKSLAKRTRTNRGVRFVVREVLTPFGEGWAERVRKVREMGELDGSGEGERMAWWKRREQRGSLKK